MGGKNKGKKSNDDRDDKLEGKGKKRMIKKEKRDCDKFGQRKRSERRKRRRRKGEERGRIGGEGEGRKKERETK